MKELILGGARSGKSRRAEQQAKNTGKSLFYVATARIEDSEMQTRIAHHQQRRGDDWTLVEAPLQLAERIQEVDHPAHAIVVDCLTLWLSNALHEQTQELEINSLLEVLPSLSADIFLVSNEVGSGIVPLGELSRQFVDECGWLHQKLAQLCDVVTLVVAGLPLSLKQTQK